MFLDQLCHLVRMPQYLLVTLTNDYCWFSFFLAGDHKSMLLSQLKKRICGNDTNIHLEESPNQISTLLSYFVMTTILKIILG